VPTETVEEEGKGKEITFSGGVSYEFTNATDLPVARLFFRISAHGFENQ
jgi:hypothetical protein